MARLASSSPADFAAVPESEPNAAKSVDLAGILISQASQALRRKSAPFPRGSVPVSGNRRHTLSQEVCAHCGPEMVELPESPRAVTVAAPEAGLSSSKVTV